MLFNIKNLRNNSILLEMWFQRLSVVIGYIDFIYDSLTIYINFGCCLILKIELIVFVEMCFQRLSGIIGYIDSEYDSVNNI